MELDPPFLSQMDDIMTPPPKKMGFSVKLQLKKPPVLKLYWRSSTIEDRPQLKGVFHQRSSLY